MIYEFSGIMISTVGRPDGPVPESRAYGGDPVSLSTGLFVLNYTDLVLPDILPIAVGRTYRTADNGSYSFGIGATASFDLTLFDPMPNGVRYQEAYVIMPDGSRYRYDRISPGGDWQDAIFEHTTSGTPFYQSRLTWRAPLGWTLTLRDGTVFEFPESMGATSIRHAAIEEMRDRLGNRIKFTRNAAFEVTRIASPNGRYIDLTYDASHRVTQAKDNTNRTVNYTYDGSGRLWKVTDVGGGITEYGYDTSNRMTTIKDAKGITYLTNQYDANGRVTLQTQADSTTYQFAYTLDGSGKVTQTDVTDPRGNIRRVNFNSAGYMSSEKFAYGTALEQTVTYTRQSGTNFMQRVTDGLGRHTDFAYDAFGNVTSVTSLAGTGNAVSSSFTYNSAFNTLATVTDPLNHTTTFGYDSKGDLTSVSDPLSHQSTFSYNSAGQLITAKDAYNNTASFAYSLGDMVSSTDPLGKSSSQFVDAAGRVLTATNATGQQVKYEYDVLNRVTKVTDPLQGTTQFSYDANNNLLSVTDARSNAIQYVYDNMDRVVTRKDPLLREVTYEYNNNGLLKKTIDRKGLVTQYSYDALDRLTLITYNDASTTAYTYDAGNRVTQVVDSVSGTITYSYDNLDRLLSETTPQGVVSYNYDAAGRRTTTSISGQSQISYSYDNADRLTQITQGSATVSYVYDNADRVTSVTQPNGVLAEYGYDAASRLTALTYKKSGVTIGTLSYEYDAAGRRVKMGGSLAQTGLPSALTTTAYNAANHQTAFGANTLTYDLNGNLTGDGMKTYTWNARNQLTAISGGGVTASFSYDAFGRRISKTINSTTTGFLYDGANIVQEQAGGSATANMLTGGVDQFFSRTDASGTTSPLADALGSVVALTDSTGAIQTQYSYEPFGKSSTSGTASSNSQKYTGREDDGTGLFYYRARYYSPDTQRFISEDPIGLAGGDINLFAYVGNSPVMATDPSGLEQFTYTLDSNNKIGIQNPQMGGRSCSDNGYFYGGVPPIFQKPFWEKGGPRWWDPKEPRIDRGPRFRPPNLPQPPVGNPQIGEPFNPKGPMPPGPSGPGPMAPQNPSLWWKIKAITAEVAKAIGNGLGMGSRYTAPIIVTPTSIIRRMLDTYKGGGGGFQDAKVDNKLLPERRERYFNSEIALLFNGACGMPTFNSSNDTKDVEKYNLQGENGK